MGNFGAIGMADAVRAGQVTLAGALEWHLGANHYPPVRSEWLQPCVRAVQLAGSGAWKVEIPTPNGPMAVEKIVDGLHLYPFISDEEEDR